jgi:chromosome segregation ATPase
MNMDPTQTSQMLKWLDEERQKDKTLLTALQERLETQAQQLMRQEEQLNDLQRSVAGMEALMSRVRDFDQAMENLRVEVASMLDQRDEQRRKEQRELERAHKLDIGAVKDEMTRLNEILQPTRMAENMTALKAEDSRLNEQMQKLETTIRNADKKSQDGAQSLIYLEEQRQADNRRIASLEAETTDLRKRAEGADSKLLLLEEMIQKERARIEDGLTKLKGFDSTFEEMRVADFKRQQEYRKWETQAEEARREIQSLKEERQNFMQQFQQNKRALDTLDAFQQRMETRQNEVAEMQRLAEDRAKRAWEEWQAATDKTMRSRELAVEEDWKQQERLNKEHADTLKKLQDGVSGLCLQTQTLCESLASSGLSRVEALQDQLGTLQGIVQAVREL